MSKQCSSCGGDCGHEKTGHCMYGIIHESGCARHNMQLTPKRDCNCYLSKLTSTELEDIKAIVAKWDYATEAAIEAYLLGKSTAPAPREVTDEEIVKAAKKCDTNTITLTVLDNDGNEKPTFVARQFADALLGMREWK